MDFIVNRANLRKCEFVQAEAVELQSGQVRLRVAKFAFTSNNISYAATGDLLSYWKFFPTREGWGRVPVWGFGDVIESRHDAVAEGERVYGYLPMSQELVVQPSVPTPQAWMDVSPQRSALPLVYNQYLRVANDPDYQVKYEDHQALLRPLFTTAFLLEDFIAEQDAFGAEVILLSSASSKTALGLASLLSRKQAPRYEVIGLTSVGNVGFVEDLGYYDRVIPYEALRSLPAERPVVFVDMAGNGAVVEALHRHFGDNLKHSCQVGATHWERGQRATDLPGPPPTFFFAPTQAQKRAKDWGGAVLQRRLGQAWAIFLESTTRWIHVVHGQGPAAVEKVYRDTLEGRSRPDQGHILSLWERD